MKTLLSSFKDTFTFNPKNDILSGLTVALALVPEAVAFAFVAGVEPLVGLYAAFLVGLITSIFGGRPGMISGATGALAVVMVTLVANHGVEYLFATVVLMGILQVLAGIFKLGRFIRLVPHPVMFGFVNGLAIVIFLAQLGQFKAPNAEGVMTWLAGDQLGLMLGLVALTMGIIHFLPKLTKAIPAPLVGILAVTVLVHGIGLDTRTVLDTIKDMGSDGMAGGLPVFSVPSVPFNLETLRIIFPYSLVLASIGLIESLMTLTLVDEITETRGSGNQECVGQGVANIVTGFFGGMGGCAMIGQSMINVNSGGRGRLSGLSAAIFLLCFILFGAPLIEMIPLAALVGVMFMVVIGTFEWSSFRILNKIPRSDAFVLVLVSAVTVWTDLAVAVGIGVVTSALVFAWEKSKRIGASVRQEEGTKVYEMEGPLFFASVQSFRALFDAYEDPEDVTIDFKNSRVYGHSGIEAIDAVAQLYARQGKVLHLVHLSEDCQVLLKRSGCIVETDKEDDPRYRVAVDLSRRPAHA